MIYNYTKCESVIAKIMADLDSAEYKQRVTDIREWIFEAVEKIGAPMQYLNRESGKDGVPVLKIEDHQVPMPDDIVTLDGVAYSHDGNGPWVPMIKSTKIFHNKPNVPTTQPKVKEELVDLSQNQPTPYKLMTAQSQIYTANNSKYVNGLNKEEQPEYFLKPGWIVTNKDNGFIKIAYKSIAKDERGYPLIPDLPSYQEAIYWYVVMKLSFPKYMQGSLSGKTNKYSAKYAAQSYQYIESKWHFYRNQAYAEAMMPTAGDMQNIKRDWNKLVIDFDGERRFFDNIADDQQFYGDYYYGY